MKKNIAILAGGDSSEYDVSIGSARQIAGVLDRSKYVPYTILLKANDWHYADESGNKSIDKNDFSLVIKGKKIRFDFAIIAIHGTPGENGILQGYFDLLRIPYSTCNVHVSALTFNKFSCNTFLRGFEVLTAKSDLIRKKDKYDLKEITDDVGLPCFVKPNEGGSSCGVSKVSKYDDMENAVQKAFAEDDQILIEQYIKGTEITCGLIKTGNKEIIFPLTEIVSKNEFFDYEAKYNAEKSEEITPARVSKDIEKRCKQLSSKIYDLLGCRGVVRIDYILSGNQLYFLEINTVPGMSENSIVPKMARAHGMSLTELFTLIIEEEGTRH
ncbi:MAG: D-alanine--D-alanine ligase [Bacteroidia bacterium]|nr:D-alanine--D-alanine ligase [Bacteroidia bacterium]